MGMSFQGPPPPLPAFWKEPALWVTASFTIACLAATWAVQVALVQAAAVLGASFAVSAYSHLRLSAAREARLGQTGFLRRKGGS